MSERSALFPILSRVLLAAVALGALGACGYQLRGSGGLPEGLSSVYIDSQSSVIANELQLYVEAAGASRASSPTEADATIKVGTERYDRRVLSVDATTGKEREFELSYVVSFSFTRKDGEELVSWQPVRLIRDFEFDADAVIGSSREEDTLREEMRRDAVQQMLRRIQAAVRR